MLMLLVCPDQDIHPYVSSLSAAEMSNRIHPLVLREGCDDVFREVIILLRPETAQPLSSNQSSQSSKESKQHHNIPTRDIKCLLNLRTQFY